MRDLLVEIVGETYATLAFWALTLIAVALILWLVLYLLRRLTPGTFVSSGRRQQRLAVTDATPVDNQRRLILVRRDNVEHLVLIGGPSDVVVERNIPVPGTAAQPRVSEPFATPREVPARPSAPQPETPRPQPAPRPVEPQRRPEAPVQIATAQQPSTANEPFSAAPSRTTIAAGTAPAFAPQPERREPPAPANHHSTTSDAVTERREPQLPSSPSEDSLEDEMSRFLDELSDERK